MPRVEARVTCPRPETHLVHVELRVPALPAPGERVLLAPRWIPGSYKIRDFGRHVQGLEVRTANGRRLPTRRTRTDGWSFADPADGPLTVTYQVYCRDLTVDTSHVTHSHLYLHGVTCFLYDDTTRSLPWRVTLEVPSDWQIWTGLPSEGKARNRPRSGAPPELRGRAVLLADDYDHLVDCPIEAGPAHHVERFRAAGKTHRLVVWNPPDDVDWSKVRTDLGKLVEEAAAIFGGLPYSDYTFIAHVAKGHGGGLEHKNSTVLGVDPLHLTDKKQYATNFLALVAHEFFHVWNVRRIQPAVFRPFDYQNEVMTGLLWLFEGGTSYYEIPLMLRSKVAEPKHVYEVLADMVKYMEMAVGRHRLSVADASRLTWVKLYQRHESNINTNVSYYSKGALVCLCLDAYLRQRGSSLDVVMRHLWTGYEQQNRGVPEDSLATIVKEATGVNVSTVLRKWIDEPGELPVDASLRALGLKIERDAGDKDNPLGLGIQLDEEKLRITAVPDRWDTPDGLPRQGKEPVPHPLDPDDEIVAVDGWKVTHKDLAKYVNRKKKGDTVRVAMFRDGKLLHVDVPVIERQKDKVKIEEDKKASAAAKRRRTAWKRARRR